jgi:hypothetical protein
MQCASKLIFFLCINCSRNALGYYISSVELILNNRYRPPTNNCAFAYSTIGETKRMRTEREGRTDY